METPEARMGHLAVTFPSMRGRAGVMGSIPPWDAEFIDSWAFSGGPSHGERVTAQFLLMVWNPDHPWEIRSVRTRGSSSNLG